MTAQKTDPQVKENTEDWQSIPLVGTELQVEWAQRIRVRVSGEFDRVGAALRSVSEKQSLEKRAHTAEVLSLLAEKRLEVMTRNQAGYFIKTWQEIGDQVKQMIAADARYHVLQRTPR